VKLTVLVAISDPRTIVARRLENDCRLSDPANPSELYCSSPLALCYHKSRGNSEGGTMIQNKVSYGRQPSTSLDTQVMHEEFRCQFTTATACMVIRQRQRLGICGVGVGLRVQVYGIGVGVADELKALYV
jgi:hypothetical protein